MRLVNNPKLDNRADLSASSGRQNRPAFDTEWFEHAHPYFVCYEKFVEDPVELPHCPVQIPSRLDSKWSDLHQTGSAVEAIACEIVGFLEEIKIAAVGRKSLLKGSQHAQHVR
jgi:hypothetical protein